MRCLAGLLVCGLGIVLIIDADLGVAPWDVLHQGISARVGLPIGTVILLVGAVVLALWWPLRMRPGRGHDPQRRAHRHRRRRRRPARARPPRPGGPGRPRSAAGHRRASASAAGSTSGPASVPGPRDGLMTGLAARGYSIRPHAHGHRARRPRRRLGARADRSASARPCSPCRSARSCTCCSRCCSVRTSRPASTAAAQPPSIGAADLSRPESEAGLRRPDPLAQVPLDGRRCSRSRAGVYHRPENHSPTQPQRSPSA